MTIEYKMQEQAEQVQDRINRRFDELYRQTEAGLFQSHICLICDELLKPKQVQLLSTWLLKKNSAVLKANTWNDVSADLSSCYRYMGDFDNSATTESPHWIQELLLSPRACYMRRLENILPLSKRHN
jgi:hypothetical protein